MEKITRGATRLIVLALGLGLLPSAWADYKPSININFTNGSGLTTAEDVGLTGYEVPGTSWNNFTVANNTTYSTVNAIDSTGAASTMSGVSVTVSGTRGSYSCSTLTAASNPLHGYIDEDVNNMTPTVTITGIPYYKYRVIVYHSTDTGNAQFGYDTINGSNYTYVNDALSEGTTAWGNSGADNSANAISEGGNVLVTDELSGPTLTVVGHRGNSSSVRGCIAAIQIIEVKPDAGENDLVIEVSGDMEYTVTETRDDAGAVYITGSGTLTLAGEAKISAATVNVGSLVTLNANSDRLDATAYTGGGTVVYDGIIPPTGKGWTDSTWSGTVWLKNKSGITGNIDATTDVQPNSLGNANSKVKFSGVSGWLEAPITYNPEIVLENAGYDYALQLTNGNSPGTGDFSNRCTVVKKLSGSGTLGCGSGSWAWPLVQIWDATGFTGSINTSNAGGNGQGYTGLVVVFCDEDTSFSDSLYNLFRGEGANPHPRTIYVASGKTVTQASTATWTAVDGFGVDGTLIADGAIASSSETKAVSGSGTVVFNGKLPSPTGDAWWKNSDWTGTVQLTSVAFTGVSGVDTYLEVNKYGNDGSMLELNNCSGWLPVGDTAGDNVCTVPLKVTGTLTINNGYSGRTFTINKLSGSGTIFATSSNPAQTTIQILEADDFTGCVQLNSRRVVFGETIPSGNFVSGQIYVGSGFMFTVPNSEAAWFGTGGIVLDGELKAASLSNFGGGTTITTTDNGVLTRTSGDGVEGETDTDYARIQGTGSLKYEGAGWRALSTNNFPTTMTLVNEQAGDILLSRALTYIVGSLAGTKNLQGNYGSGARYLRVLQSKDTEWSGIVISDGSDRFKGLTVAPGAASTAGTLTLSGMQVKAQTLTVESGAKVNLTGTWIGATTVEGTIGGTGTIDGNLTVNGGNISFGSTSAAPLNVTGNVAFLGAITIVYPAGTKLENAHVLMSATGSMSRNGATFTVKAGDKVIGHAVVSGNTLCAVQDRFILHIR